MDNERLREAYEATIERANKEGKSDFMCCTLLCSECPFKMYVGHCTDASVEDGAGRKRTVEEWREWWKDLTGEENSTEKSAESTKDSSEPTGEDTLQPTVTSEDSVAPTVMTVDIIWTTATGNVKHRAGPIVLLDTNLRQFSKEVEVWISEMIKPDTCNDIADSITFVARDETGAVLANVELYAEMFGKCKVWENIVK